MNLGHFASIDNKEVVRKWKNEGIAEEYSCQPERICSVINSGTI